MKHSGTTESISLPQQNYIETIADLEQDRGTARVSDLAARLKISKPSVSEAIGRLTALGFINRKSRSEIHLTTKGRKIAERLDRRQHALHEFMVEVLGMSDAKAQQLACELEHNVDQEFSEGLHTLAEILQDKPKMLKKISRDIMKAETKRKRTTGKGKR